MARVTVEDCVEVVPNRFDLVLLAAQRARGISAGEALTIDRDRDKNPVVSLREIAEKSVGSEDLTEQLIASMQRHVEVDEPEEDAPQLTGPTEDQPVTLTEEDLLRALRTENEAPAEGYDRF